MEIAGKTALVTGSALRIGKLLALRLAESGAHIVLHYGKSAAEAELTRQEIVALGVNCFCLPADLMEAAPTANLIPQAVSQCGPIDILINSASVFPAEEFMDATVQCWDDCMSVNLKAPFLLSQAFAKQLDEGRQGKIINLLDTSSLRPQNHHFSYTISKYALDGLTSTMAVALASRNIQVNGIALGAILPNSNDNDPEAFARLALQNPSLRNGSPDDVANAMMYLLRDADYVTGETLRIDGGQHLV